MSINALTVILATDLRDDDAQPLIDAIKQLRGVVGVEPHITTFEDAIAQSRVRTELGNKLLSILWPSIYGKEQA